MHRKIMGSSIWTDSNKFKLWTLCLMRASHKEREVFVGNQVVSLQSGQFVTGRKALAEEFNKGVKKSQTISEKTIERYLALFEEMEMLTIKKTTKYSVISILNWHLYQQSDQQLTNKNEHFEQKTDQQMTIKKEPENTDIPMFSEFEETKSDHNLTNKCPTKSQKLTTNKNVLKNVVVEETPSQEQVNIITDKYMRLKGRGFPGPDDYSTANQLLQEGVPFNEILFYLDECFQNYKPKHSMDRINSFRYCASYIYNRWHSKQQTNKPLTVIPGKQKKRQAKNAEILAKYE
ncbi:hypothetical protein ABR763_26195 [Bacillus cereus]